MAVFEKNKSSKVLLDDTVPLSCFIETSQNVKDHVEYTIRVQRGLVPSAESQWLLQKRYSDFALLDANLKIAGYDLQLPPKKVFGNFDREFVAERKQALQAFINGILNNLMLASSIYTKRFLDSVNYAANLQEIALQQVSMFFRSETQWEVIESLPDIGWRLRKSYFLVRSKHEPKTKYVLSWSDFGPDKFIPDKDLSAIMKLIPSFQHDHLYPTVLGYSNEVGGLTIRPYIERGSLRDYINKAKPRNYYLKKYGKPDVKKTTRLSLGDIKSLGAQVLETLKYLHEKGIPYGHLSAANIMLEGRVVKLMDIENTLLGLPPFYRTYVAEFKKMQTTEAIDVYAFGHLLYEMAFGELLNDSTCYILPPDCPAELRSVLESILTLEACKNGLPSVTDLLTHPLFSEVILPPSTKPVVKIPSKLKDVIRLAKDATERRLNEEQKIINKIRRRSKAQSYHMSEEEKKKRRKSKKKSVADEDVPDEDSPTNGSSSIPPATPTSPTSPTVPAPPPPPPPTAGPPPPPAPGSATESSRPSSSSAERGALLSSITGFSKNALKKAETVDKSAPRI